RPPGVAAGR
ncbi:hypothetical protein SM139_0952, partial [Stenotrophomonas maltophilia]